MKNLTTLIVLCLGLLCQASPKPKDTIYTNVESLMKEVRTTQKKTATYYLVLNDEDKEVKVRIDLKQIDCEIPIYKSESFDIKKLMALKEETLTEPNQKLEIIDTKSKEWRRLKNDVSTLTKEHNTLKADTLSLDSTAIAKVEEDLQDKMKNFKKVDAEITKIFNEYEAMMDSLMGNLRTQYHERLVAAMEEAYEKIENKETTFKSVDDDAHIWDIRMDLLKIDATREMKIPRRLEKGEETTEKITAGKLYYLLHFAEFGAWYEREEVTKVFSSIKLWEFHLNPYLVDKQFGLVCDDQYRTQHYINSVVDYKNYSGSLENAEDKPKPGDPLINMQIVHNNSAKNSGGKFGCSRVGIGCDKNSIPNLPKFGDNEKVHGGVDLYCELNTKVYAMFDGVVEKMVNQVVPNTEGNLGDFGNRVRIRSTSKEHIGNGKVIYVYYTHLNHVEKLKVGDKVKQGQLLGLSGKTGNAHNIPIWRYHTHISIYEGSPLRKNRVNPLDYFTTKDLVDKNN